MSNPDTISIISLPEKYKSRPATLDDAEAVVELQALVSQAKGIAYKANPDIQRADWQEPDFHIENSTLIIEDGDDIVGYAVIWDNSAKPVRPWCPWSLRDDLYGSGIEDFILNWIHEKAQRVLDKVPAEAKVSIMTNAFEGYDKRLAVLEKAGFTHARNFYRMLVELDDVPPTATLPDHISMRGLNYPDEIETMAKAVEIGFKDHWGFVEEPIEEAVKFWEHYLRTDNLFDPELYLLAIDNRTGEIAGVALCRIEQVGKPEAAYVEELAVLPKYRRQGIALGMLHHAFGELYKRGRRQVALHVDAESLTGATRLYGKAGMKPVETWMNFQTILRDGVEISTSSVE